MAQIISFNCLLKNKTGQFISSTFNRDVLTEVQTETDMLASLAKGLQEMKKGERRSIELSAEEAYGLYEPKKVIFFPRNKLSKVLKIGDAISIKGKSGTMRDYRVVDFFGDMASLDGNHPLAGQDLVFEIEALDVREATQLEISESSNSISRQLLN
jgi:FKBP-type peptidyl-prolyl cis-trans isomerase SlyD